MLRARLCLHASTLLVYDAFEQRYAHDHLALLLITTILGYTRP